MSRDILFRYLRQGLEIEVVVGSFAEGFALLEEVQTCGEQYGSLAKGGDTVELTIDSKVPTSTADNPPRGKPGRKSKEEKERLAAEAAAAAPPPLPTESAGINLPSFVAPAPAPAPSAAPSAAEVVVEAGSAEVVEATPPPPTPPTPPPAPPGAKPPVAAPVLGPKVVAMLRDYITRGSKPDELTAWLAGCNVPFIEGNSWDDVLSVIAMTADVKLTSVAKALGVS